MLIIKYFPDYKNGIFQFFLEDAVFFILFFYKKNKINTPQNSIFRNPPKNLDMIFQRLRGLQFG